MFSDDLNHDYHFVVKTIKDTVIPELNKVHVECHFTEVHCRSDGCAGKYKSCNAFGDMSRVGEDLGVPYRVRLPQHAAFKREMWRKTGQIFDLSGSIMDVPDGGRQFF